MFSPDVFPEMLDGIELERMRGLKEDPNILDSLLRCQAAPSRAGFVRTAGEIPAGRISMAGV